jgi:ABC-type enterochelin transport system permease subunit
MRGINWASPIPLSGPLGTDSFAVCAVSTSVSTGMKRAQRQCIPEISGLLALYRFWGAAAVASFAAFLFLLAAAMRNPAVSYPLLVMSLFAGFLWIGTTSISRHSLIRLKDTIGERVGLFEFLSTQFVFILFPYSYRKLKKEVERYAENC